MAWKRSAAQSCRIDTGMSRRRRWDRMRIEHFEGDFHDDISQRQLGTAMTIILTVKALALECLEQFHDRAVDVNSNSPVTKQLDMSARPLTSPDIHSHTVRSANIIVDCFQRH
eukprot:754526-Hanusia_phi.AAC.1